MNDKEKKLREALNEYFGRDVGDITRVLVQPVFNQSACDLVLKKKCINITVKPHEPTYEERRKKLVDQLNKELKEIDDNYSVVKGIASPDVTYIHYDARPYCELYPNGNINFHGVYDSVKQMTKVMETISGFSWKLKRLKEQYKDETI